MDKEIASYITAVIAKDLDSRRPKGMMDCSSSELEAFEKALINDWSDEAFRISVWIRRKLKTINENVDNSRPPVKDELSKARFAIDAAIARNNTQQYNYSNFDAIEYLETLINSVSKSGGNSCTTTQYMELVEIVDNEEKYDADEETKRILWHFRSLGFTVKTEDDVENKTIKITISW